MITSREPILKQLLWYSNASINFKVETGDDLINNMHYHPEIELILLKRCSGKRIIGANIGHFSHNDVLLIGKNVPHIFLHEEQSLKPQKSSSPEALVIQFRENFLQDASVNLPELKGIQRLFQVARHGLSLTNEGKKKVVPLIERMSGSSSLKRILLLLEVLDTMINRSCFTVLTESGFSDHELKEDNHRMEKVLSFVAENFDRNIKIDEVAEIINLTKESFCRYFKTQTGKTFMKFLIEYRVSKACQMIKQNSKTIKEIGYSCGFDSLSNFHHQFKKIINHSPLEYKRLIKPDSLHKWHSPSYNTGYHEILH